MRYHSSALYIKLKGSPCLTYVGTEGMTSSGRLTRRQAIRLWASRERMRAGVGGRNEHAAVGLLVHHGRPRDGGLAARVRLGGKGPQSAPQGQVLNSPRRHRGVRRALRVNCAMIASEDAPPSSPSSTRRGLRSQQVPQQPPAGFETETACLLVTHGSATPLTRQRRNESLKRLPVLARTNGERDPITRV